MHLWHETFGDKKNPALLLIMGASAQALFWPDAFCKTLMSAGYYVIRYDHRDTGQSQLFDYTKEPYDLNALADDALKVLDELQIEKTNVVGTSMGGFLAQLLALKHPERLLTMALIASTPDLSPFVDVIFKRNSKSLLPPPLPPVFKMLTTKPKKPALTLEDKIKAEVATWHILHGAAAPFPTEFYLQIARAGLAHAKNPAHAANHLLAIAKTDFTAHQTKLTKINIPTLVIHGSADPILPLQHGEALAKAIPNSKLLILPTMGHMLAPEFWQIIIDAILANIKHHA